MTIPSLILQKPHPKSPSKEHVQILARRLDEWKKGNVSSLLHKGRCIQQRLHSKKGKRNSQDDDLAKAFARFMRQGKVGAAICLLSKHEAGILNLNEKYDAQDERTVLEELTAKTPKQSTNCGRSHSNRLPWQGTSPRHI